MSLENELKAKGEEVIKMVPLRNLHYWQKLLKDIASPVIAYDDDQLQMANSAIFQMKEELKRLRMLIEKHIDN